MAKCYECRYYRVGERRCAYDGAGYTKSPSDDCGHYWGFEGDQKKCCGNCKYFRTDDKRCVHNGNTYEMWHECGIGEYSPA